MYQSRIRNTKGRSGRPNKYRELVIPEDDQEYAIVTDMLGNGRVRVTCDVDGTEEVCIGRICGSMRKFKSKVIIERGDLVLVSRRDFEPSKVDVMHKYAHDEVSILVYQRDLPERLMRLLTNPDNTEGDEYIMFADAEGEASIHVEDLDIDTI
jgi:translation initiation factor 1A